MDITPELKSEYKRTMENLDEKMKTTWRSFWEVVAIIKKLKETKIQGLPLWKASSHSTWKDFYEKEIKERFDNRALSTTEGYIWAYSRLKEYKKDIDFSKIKPGNAKSIAKRISSEKVENGEKKELLKAAEESREEVERIKRPSIHQVISHEEKKDFKKRQPYLLIPEARYVEIRYSDDPKEFEEDYEVCLHAKGFLWGGKKIQVF